ncbi:sugar ABC transporter ATP-binding protein [Adhaeribacter pallidiroseus]|uniref:ABC transporter G family member 23 n=1 Tax=Adhaeribacter pallidiroseus TaxID=2072847 RepID=A0A369QHX2_9BACT|nr:sugar ABC transporter ATP-binding protein [Adhaeribacter pallidiroseus]RDC62826.1 ABC transporter G family member 23 [Adhaeribacter pallidiroseus]
MVLQLQEISKYFPGVKALEAVSFDLQPGEVHALCGENGAGKSTLMNILTGNLQPDAGTILLHGQPTRINGPAHAAELGIAIVYQQLSLTDALSVAENIFANQQPRNAWGFIQYAKLYGQTRALLQDLQIDYIQPKQLVADLSPAEKQMVEIAKALAKKPRILLLDEPTASITARETKTLFTLIKNLKKEGKSIIYISHRLPEIFEIADRVSVLKDGHYQGTQPIAAVTPENLIRLMVGRDLLGHDQASGATNQELLRVVNLAGPGFANLNFTLHKGEILGLAGLIGAGRSEMAQTLFGYLPRQQGQVFINGQEVFIHHPAEAIAAGMGYVPEERKSQGLFLDRTITENVVAANLAAAAPSGYFDFRIAQTLALEYKEKLQIATPHVQQVVRNLSGGNQQKVVLAKWLLTNPEVLLVDEPTHGIDVGAKSEIYQLLRQLATAGKGILLISSELPELLALADRILVIRQGTIRGELPGCQTTEEEIMALASW